MTLAPITALCVWPRLTLSSADEKLRMPRKKKLCDSQIADLMHWIKIGAPDPRTTQKAVAAVLAKASEH